MQYIIMCGGDYKDWSDKPKQMIEVNGEPIVARTIRLLRDRGVKDIAISSNNPIFEQFDVPVLHHENKWEVFDYSNVKGSWVNAFYPTDYPVCYLLGDVVFSRSAIKKIVRTDTKSIEFFASAPPFDPRYKKQYAEPYAFKVVDTEYFHKCIEKVKQYEKEDKFKRSPIAWELWQVIKKTPLNAIDYTNYIKINDYTCDIDWIDEVEIFDGINDVKE